MYIVEMGRGAFLFSQATRGGRHGILIAPAHRPARMGEVCHDAPKTHQEDEEGVFIAVPDMKSVSVLLEQVSLLAVAVSGLERRTPAPKTEGAQ